MDANEVECAALIQVYGQFDNTYLMNCVRDNPARLVPVVIVDVNQRDAPDVLEDLVQRGAVGVRLCPGDRSPGDDPLTIWRKAAELEIPVDLYGGYADFVATDFAQLAGELPDLTLIIEHLGGIGSEEAPTPVMFESILSLARFPNTYIKLHGLGEICPRPVPFPVPMRFESVPPFMAMAIEAFGPQRVMWGSDFPPVAGREGYRNALSWTRDHLSFCDEAAKHWIFADTAVSVFRMD